MFEKDTAESQVQTAVAEAKRSTTLQPEGQEDDTNGGGAES